MPLYEYRCSSCGTRSEHLEPVSAPVVRVCPDCGAEATRCLGVPALQFKGSGWYVTDDARSPAADRASATKGGAGSSGGTASSGAAA